MLSVEEAKEKVLAAVAPLPPAEIPVSEALGKVPAGDLYAPHDLPRFANSAMDGYAVRAEDLSGASEDRPVRLRLIGEARAGSAAANVVETGTAVRIMTGAPLPQGADAVVPVEHANEQEDGVHIGTATASGAHVRSAGEDVSEGELLMRAGTELGPGELALIASLGLSPLMVHPSPRVAIVVTGEELVVPELEPDPGKIRDSNTVALNSLLQVAGADIVMMERVGDDREATHKAFTNAAGVADLIVSSGGVAVGRYDYVKEVIEEIGELDMWKVAMKPGKPVVLGRVQDVPLLGLPGNPVSVHVAFEQFVRPCVRRMRGCRTYFRPQIRATLTHSLDKSAGRQEFVRVRLARSGEGWYATPTGPQGSHIQSSLVLCHGLAIFEAGESHLDEGADVAVEVWRLPVASGPTKDVIETEAEPA